MAIQHMEIRVTGRVQGVFFRYSARETAMRLGISGWVRNESDGSVSIEAEGPEPKLNQFLQWCRQGPTSAIVTDVEWHQGKVCKYKDFKLKW
jgi:acylphosphatase